MAGRPASMLAEKMNQDIIDAVLSLWTYPEEELSFTYIHQGLVKKGIVQDPEYRYKTDRILKKLVKMKLIRKAGRGRYQLNVEPDEFKVFNYLQMLRQRQEVERFRVGGSLWTLTNLYLLGMPKSVWDYEDAKFTLQILNIRISCLFEALGALASAVKKREKEPQKSKPLLLPRQVIRELLLELISYSLGSQAGMDFDGLPLDELNIIIPKMIQSLPNEVTPQSPTRKNLLMKYYLLITKLMRDSEHDIADEEELLLENVKNASEDFALVVTRPEDKIDGRGYEQRWLKQDLLKYSSKDKSALYIASSILHRGRQNILRILDVYGHKYLGRHKLREVRELYEKLYVSDWIAEIINDFDCYGKEEQVEAKEFIQDMIDEFGLKTVIFYLPFSYCNMNFILPTLEKEEILHKHFQQLPIETIHEWLGEGANLAREISDEKIKDVLKVFEKIEPERMD